MTTTRLAYYNNQELPAWVVSDLKDDTGTQYDMSSGWTFTVTLARTTAPATALAIKSTGITASATAITVAWSTSDWSGLEASVNGTSYVVILQAVRTSDSYSIAYRPQSPPTLTLKAAPGTSAVSPSSYPITVSASTVTFTPTGTIAATDVQSAITEVALEAGATSGPRILGAMAAPTGAVAQTMARQHVQGGTVALTSTRQQFTLIYLPAGTINTISILSGSVGATTPTNQWFSLYDLSRNKLAVTNDDTTTAWASDTVKTLTIPGGYTVATAGYYYVGAMVAASIPPSFCGFTLASAALATLAPIMCARDNTNIGLSTPATAPATATFVPSTTTSFYAYVS